MNILSLNYKNGELIKVSPIGEIEGADGRTFKIDAKKIIENIKKNGVDIVLDENHSFAGAVGWFDKDSFEAKDDGIYAKLELNKRGMELVKDKIYRYLSPVYDLSGRDVLSIESVGLVNKPNVLNNALNNKGDKVENEKNSELDALNEKVKKLEETITSLNKELEGFKKDDQKVDESDKANESDNADESGKADEDSKELNSRVLKIENILKDFKKMKNESDENKEINSRLESMENTLKTISSFFGKKDLEANSKSDLSDDEKKVALMLGLSFDEYKGAK
ncbi:phage protease [Campylobacter ureolyticus]|nr:phage protease [Campylobacter ureolyticus]